MHEPEMEWGRLRGRPACVFENHATALLPWWELLRDRDQPIVLITLDHHTDTNSAYLRDLFKQVGRDLEEIEKRRCERLRNIQLSDRTSMVKALEGLYHDEHIDVAMRLGMFERTYVIQHSHDQCLPEWLERKMEVWPTEITLSDSSEEEKEHYYSQALEDDFLSRQLQQCPKGVLAHEQYILDIDLDYFKTKASLQPQSSKVFEHLVDHALGVTIAKEEEWVDRLFIGERVSTDFMLDALGFSKEISSFPVKP